MASPMVYNVDPHRCRVRVTSGTNYQPRPAVGTIHFLLLLLRARGRSSGRSGRTDLSRMIPLVKKNVSDPSC